MADTEKVTVEFVIKPGRRDDFLMTLQKLDQDDAMPTVIGFRADDFVQRREALVKFVDRMEEKLRKNDHKTTWRKKPIKALVQLMKLEIAEADVAMEFFTVEEARTELVDISNFAMIVWDRLGMLDEKRNLNEQIRQDQPVASVPA